MTHSVNQSRRKVAKAALGTALGWLHVASSPETAAAARDEAAATAMAIADKPADAGIGDIMVTVSRVLHLMKDQIGPHVLGVDVGPIYFRA